MAKYTARGSAFGAHANRFKQPEFITREDRWAELERFQKFCPDCTWDGCQRPRFFDMPVCQGHAFIIYGRYHDALSLNRPDRIAYEPPAGPDPVVYYLMRGPQTVKIGTTKWLRDRVRNLYSELQYVIALELGGLELEHQRHREFADERIERENFYLSERLKKHIETLIPQRDKLMALASRPGGYRTSA